MGAGGIMLTNEELMYYSKMKQKEKWYNDLHGDMHIVLKPEYDFDEYEDVITTTAWDLGMTTYNEFGSDPDTRDIWFEDQDFFHMNELRKYGIEWETIQMMYLIDYKEGRIELTQEFFDEYFRVCETTYEYRRRFDRYP